MCTMPPWKICNSFDITHQAHIRGGWKIWILCHMCSYQKNNMIFGFLKTMKLCHTMSTFALCLLEGNKMPMKIILDFSKFQHSPIMLDFTYKLWNLRKKVMLCFYPYFDVGHYKLVENRSVSQPWLPFWEFGSVLAILHFFQEF